MLQDGAYLIIWLLFKQGNKEMHFIFTIIIEIIWYIILV